ncbi:MAG: response regulator transcription factor [Bacteroidota bacterium]|nr:response regulator transcription factor [Bacteroidota bacterium]
MEKAIHQTGKVSKPSINVLIADDFPIIRTRLKQILEYESDIQITCEAGDGDEVLKCIHNFPIDVIVADLYMPNKNGFDLLKHLKETDNRIPVIVISALATSSSVKKALACGAKAFINKENAPEELAITIRNIFNSL